MNLKRILTSTLVIATLLLGACGDDDKPAKKVHLTFGEETLSLKGAKIYLDYKGTVDDTHIYQDYYITDADATGSGATYYIEFELAVPIGEEIGAGNYPAFWDWDLPTATSNIGYFYAEGGEDDEYVELDLLEDANGTDKIVVSGGVEDGDTMTVTFNGTISYYHFDGEDWITENVSAKLYFKGKVEDVSSTPVKVKQHIPGGKRAHQ